MGELNKSLAWRVYVVLKAYYTDCLFNTMLLMCMMILPIGSLTSTWHVTTCIVILALVSNGIVYNIKVKYYDRVVTGWTKIPWGWGYDKETMIMMLEDTHNYQYEIKAGYNLGNE